MATDVVRGSEHGVVSDQIPEAIEVKVSAIPKVATGIPATTSLTCLWVGRDGSVTDDSRLARGQSEDRVRLS